MSATKTKRSKRVVLSLSQRDACQIEMALGLAIRKRKWAHQDHDDLDVLVLKVGDAIELARSSR